MKKYPISFADDYLMFEEWSNSLELDDDTRNYWKTQINNQDQLTLCRKWKGKEITLQEAEDNIEEFKEISFDGKRIWIENGYSE